MAKLISQDAFQKVADLEQIFSDYREDSETSLLSSSAGKGQKIKVSSDLWNVLQYSMEVSHRTEGAFDVTCGPLSKLWRKAFRQQQFPAADEIEKAKSAVGYKYVRLFDGQLVELTAPGMSLDFGGIAVGYAVDEAMKILKKRGISIALVDGGGDILVGNSPPGKKGWNIDRVFYQNGTLATEPLEIANQAITTSGDTYRYLEWEGKRYSHILDPRTGLGLTSREIVTVTAPTCMEADAWATAMSVEADVDVYLWLKKKGIEVRFSKF
jgi:thiamine biosynthesis lipoprotein